MSKHTPGPWVVRPHTWQRGNVSVFAPKFGRAPYGACVAMLPCSDGVGGADGALANARLIAATPELLDVLKDVLALWDHHCYAHGDGKPTQLHIKVRDAIARAKGETNERC